MALQLRKHGIRAVRPLLGGFYEWKRLGFPLAELVDADDQTSQSSRQFAAEA